MIKYSFVIPCYNEERKFSKSMSKKMQFLSKQKYSWEIIFVNDGSSDKTSNLVNQFIKYNPKCNISFIDYEINRGKGYAVKQGMLRAKGQYVLFTDLDDSTKISEFPKLEKYLLSNDIVIGSRYTENSKIEVKQNPLRIFISRSGNAFVRIFTGLSYSDTQCGFKLFTQKAAKDIFSKSLIERWGFDIEILMIAKNKKYSIKEVPVVWQDEEDSKLNPVKAALQVFGETIIIRLNFLLGKYR